MGSTSNSGLIASFDPSELYANDINFFLEIDPARIIIKATNIYLIKWVIVAAVPKKQMSK